MLGQKKIRLTLLFTRIKERGILFLFIFQPPELIVWRQRGLSHVAGTNTRICLSQAQKGGATPLFTHAHSSKRLQDRLAPRIRPRSARPEE